MNTTHPERSTSNKPVPGDPERIREAVLHAAHYLPAQGPITVFVHHNTLHAFEELGFEKGVDTGGKLYGCKAYLPEDRYRQELTDERIRLSDLEQTLRQDLHDTADRPIDKLGTRYSLRLAMLQFPLHSGSSGELRWIVAETDALRKFRKEVPAHTQEQIIKGTKQWLLNQISGGHSDLPPAAEKVLQATLSQFPSRKFEDWSAKAWEAFVLNFLWRVCCFGIESDAKISVNHQTTSAEPVAETVGRHREILLENTGEDADVLVNNVLIPFCSAFLDQGFASHGLPDREAGLFESFLKLYSLKFAAPTAWNLALKQEANRLRDSQTTPLESIRESLQILGVNETEYDSFITQSLIALSGWAGMVWQMETNAEWAPHPAPPGSLIEFLAVRLILDRIALTHLMQRELNQSLPLDQLRSLLQSKSQRDTGESLDQVAFTIFQIAQVCCWKPEQLLHLTTGEWRTLVEEIKSFPSSERRRVYHRAYEGRYRVDAFDAIISHVKRSEHQFENKPVPRFQFVTCIDDREESFRRHIEEISPESQTFGLAGFYGTAMFYRGAADAHYKPLCPVSIKPKHYVIEEPLYSLAEVERRRSDARKRIGWLRHQTHMGTRSFLGGILTTLGGSLAAFPLVGRILFPHTAARIQRTLGKIVEPPATQLRIERLEADPGIEDRHLGYSVEEMTDIVEGVLRAMGLTRDWSPIILFIGHGATSLNNPHESAYNCGACSGSQGGPNARAFALMANDHRVRQGLEHRGLVIPAATYFVGGYHDTTNDSVTFADMDRLPVSHRADFEEALSIIREARARNAHERCRRFESAPLDLSPAEALRHVESRPEDLSQARPEYNHATNALTLVGRRAWHRGLYLDRRSFLSSYDPTQDDERGTILEGQLRAVIPVCAGINLEYYFSTVDVEGYGCGSKLPHNITSLIGVMAGAASDLRPGLSAQMTEIHEPLRMLFVIESTPAVMLRIIEENAGIARLIQGGWAQLAVFDAQTAQIQEYSHGEFIPYVPQSESIPLKNSSLDWYGGQRDHLGFASIASTPAQSKTPPLPETVSHGGQA